MPPRIPSSMCLRAVRAALPEFEPRTLRPFSSTASNHASTVTQRRRHRDPYALAQARARKAANISRQEVLKQERAAALSDPVRGNTTTFVQSFDTAGAGLDSEENAYLNHFITREDVDQQLKESMNLSRPAPEHDTANEQIFKMKEAHERQHQNATDAIMRIINMRNGNADARIKVNVQRCIETFGRHNTDKFLPPKSKAIPVKLPSAIGQIESPLSSEEQAARDLQPLGDAINRAGPDTGSSEVQIAILTAKIKSLADFLGTRGRKDKVGKRDLRLLVHRRAKLLKYLRRKERGGPRWQRCIEMLGLTEGTWKGEITL